MKKITSVIIASMMAAMPVFALADDASTDESSAATVEYSIVGTTEGGNSIYDMTVLPDDTATGEEPTLIQFADHNFQLSVPSGWAEQELTEDDTAASVIKLVADPETTLTASQVVSASTTVDELVAELSANEAYTDLSVALINNVLFVSYTDSASAAQVYCLPDAVNGGYIAFSFSGSADTLASTANGILSTIAITDDTVESAVALYAEETSDDASGDTSEENSEDTSDEATT